MPAILTHKAITLLTRDRLAHLHQITRRMIARKTMTGARVSKFEHKINAMARDAYYIMSAPPLADNRTMRQREGTPIGSPDLLRSVSKFAVMGSMGPDLPAFAHFFQPGQGWAFDTIHKGNPDYNREAVIARTTDMALSMNRLAEAKITATFRNSDISIQARDQTRERNKVRAYVMGHLCHVAADVISHPFINDLEWHQGIDGHGHAKHSANEMMIDAAVAKKFFRRPRTRGGQGWSDWWPGEDEIAPYFFEAYTEAFTEVYGADRRKSMADFEVELHKLGPPDMTPEFMRHGYKTYRGFALNFAYGWGYWEWFGMMTPFVLPAIFAPLIGQALPHGRELFTKPDDSLSERASYELWTLPLASGALTSLIVDCLLLPFAKKGALEHSIFGIVVQSYTLAGWLGSVVEGSLVDAPEEGLSDGVRWSFFFAVPLFMELVFTGEFVKDRVIDYDHPRPYGETPFERRALVNAVNILPLFSLVVMILMLLLFMAPRGLGSGSDRLSLKKPGFWITAALWALVLLGLWIWIPFELRNARMAEHSDETDDPLQRHGVRLFDDQTLFDDPEGSGLYYPSDLRPMARLWWEGVGDLQIRSDRFGLTFQPIGGDAQTVPGPMIPMTMTQYLQLLRDTVVDAAGAAGGLRGAVYSDEAMANYILPTGAVFAAHGDFDEGKSEKDVDEAAKEFKNIDRSDDDDAYMLYHAPKPYQAVHMGRQGTYRADTQEGLRDIGAEQGYRYVVDTVEEDPRTSEALMAQAADLGALLCMGTVLHMDDAPADSNKVYQVFRNWSLDRRRINEWKMLVSGGARSDKPDGIERYDPAMPKGLNGPDDTTTWRAPLAAATDATALSEGEETARDFGWIPTLREFVRLVEEGEDIFGTDLDPIRPDVPTAQSISRAMAYLVDAPDPLEV